MAKGSAEFGYRYGGLSSQGPGYQQGLGYDQENQKKKADQKESAVMGVYRHKPSNYGPMPSDEQIAQHKLNEQSWAEYQKEAAQERGEREQRLKQQEQDLRAGKIEGISVQSLYDQGKTADNPKVKVKFFWQALACGHKAAAYDLYEAFHTGLDGAIRKNEVAAITFVNVGKQLKEIRCTELCNKNTFTSKEADISTVCIGAARKYGGIVTEEIIITQVEKLNREISNQFGPYGDFDALINAPIEAAGQDGDSPCCLIL